ncbi:MAG: 2-C-methyl-D-erythritol 2,4-cyclodiphosphate synthase [Clostridia bacterium]|nr:2-C-methyl-D-erythritol 2,4-cyclodiphosphate synthase [Clostridia bacterium]
MIRVGYGYDVHKLTEERELFLCGEKIEYEKGLLGHSDADVALHALCDALLGAAALGDIGKHFPDTDEKYKGISSITLLQEVMRLIREKGYNAVNADITIMAQKPKLAPYIEKMRANIARAMEIDLEFISVKATTTEGLGFEGREEGISASAVVLIEK